MAKRGERQVETTLAGVTPGPHSLCVLPLPGDLRSPDLARELIPRELELFIECQPITVLEQPEKQRMEFLLAPPRTPAE